jgi:hypothetical protein
MGKLFMRSSLGDAYLRFVNLSRYLKLPKDSVTLKVGQFELDLPFTQARTYNISPYDIYSQANIGAVNPAFSSQFVANAVTLAGPGRGVEISGGHHYSGYRYAIAVIDQNTSGSTPTPPSDGVGAGIVSVSEARVGPALANPSAARAAKPNDIAPAPLRDTSPEALTELQASSQQLLGKLVKELDPQAHFVSYAPQNFVAFRQGIYLELSLNTNLPESAAGSRYKLAAMAFDDHVAHLIRPTLTYFKDEPKFDGISFSTTVHLTAKLAAAGKSEAVEFFFPFASLRCYEKYDCTGQQLIDAGTVLINGERVALDLQIAEGGPSH